MATSSRKDCARSLLMMSLFLTVMFSMLLIWFPIPLHDRIKGEIKSKIVIKQQEFARWAQMPGQLGYSYTKNITLFSHIDNKTKSFELQDIAPGENKTFHFQVQRDMTDLDYAHIRSVVDYKERYSFSLKNQSHLNEEVKVYNHGALSTWHQLNHRPDFVKAFKAVTELK